MKPIKLILKNVGPYRDEKIDFTSLDNMFLIAGNTGSGKTFIFDAITYAIYGKLPSSRVGRQSKLKSTFSTNEECATIEFVFSVSNTKYRIERVLEYDAFSSHTKKLVHKPETMTLEIFSEKTKQFEPLCQDSKISVLNLRAKEIIGLECEEFSKIVVLPQGEFAKFLKDNSNEKKETLSKLFPISSYKEIMEKIKEDADSIKQEINLISTNLVQKKSKIEFDDIQKAIQNLKEKIEFIKTDLEKQNKELKSHEKNLTELNLQKETALQLEQAQKQKNELLQKEDEISILEKKLKSSQLASSLERPFYEKHNAIKDFDEINLQLKNQTEDFNKILNEKNEHLNLQDEFLTKQNEVENLKKEFEKISKQVEKIEELKSLQESLATHENNLKKNNEKKELLEKQINDSKNQVSSIKSNSDLSDEDFLVELHNQFNQTENKLSELQKDLLECEKKYELQNKIEELKKCWQEKNTILEEKQKKYEIAQKIVNENQAILLAQKLKENEPCPVCGSIHHPQPAKQKEISEKDRTDFFAESLERITQELNLAVQEESAAQVHLDEKTELLKNYQKIPNKENLLIQKSDLENQLEILNKNIQIVNKFKTDTKIINEKIEELKPEEDFTKAEIQTLKAKIQTIQSEFFENKTFDSEKLIEEKNQFELNINLTSAWCKNWEEKNQQIQNDFSAINAKLDLTKQTAQKASQTLQEKSQIFDELLKKSSFKNEEELQKSFLKISEQQNIQDEISLWQKNLTQANAILEQSKNVPLFEKIQEKIDLANFQIAQINNQIEQKQNEFDEENKKFISLKNNFEEITELEEKLAQLQKKGIPLTKLNDELFGKNAIKTPFDTWILAMYFENVINFANKRFKSISNGRYLFKLGSGTSNKGYKGLDLSVLDSFNGTERDSSTLSGGETFMASISLALGLTDAVQNQSGGIQLDSLFIDEGFGTLDTETLDKAMEILTELQETKMIGIISHVEAFKNTIPSKILVEKTNVGSKIKVGLN